jgi:hypothetical protein
MEVKGISSSKICDLNHRVSWKGQNRGDFLPLSRFSEFHFGSQTKGFESGLESLG